MHGYQFRILCEKMYMVHELIRQNKWEELKRFVILKDYTIDDILYEINEYPGELTTCSLDEFSDSIMLGYFDGFRIEAIVPLWYDGEESDLSMECCIEFRGRKIKSIILERVHVF